MEQKKLKFNIVDIVAVILIAALLGFVGYKLANRGSGETGPSPTLSVHYTVRCEGVDRELYENCKKHLPCLGLIFCLASCHQHLASQSQT